MPEVEISFLEVTLKRFLTNGYGEEISRLLTGEIIPKALTPTRTRAHQSYSRFLTIATQGDWFQRKVRELQAASGIGGLAYLRAESCTHQHQVNTKDKAGQVVWTETQGYTFFTSGWDAEVAAVQGLEDWCRKYPEEAGDILEDRGKYVLEALEARFFSLDPGNEGLGEGNGAQYFFCTLHTIGEMMRFARFHKGVSDLCAIYHTALRSGP